MLNVLENVETVKEFLLLHLESFMKAHLKMENLKVKVLTPTKPDQSMSEVSKMVKEMEKVLLHTQPATNVTPKHGGKKYMTAWWPVMAKRIILLRYFQRKRWVFILLRVERK